MTIWSWKVKTKTGKYENLISEYHVITSEIEILKAIPGSDATIDSYMRRIWNQQSWFSESSHSIMNHVVQNTSNTMFSHIFAKTILTVLNTTSWSSWFQPNRLAGSWEHNGNVVRSVHRCPALIVPELVPSVKNITPRNTFYTNHFVHHMNVNTRTRNLEHNTSIRNSIRIWWHDVWDCAVNCRDRKFREHRVLKLKVLQPWGWCSIVCWTRMCQSNI